ncbi:MAG: TVP38/TMEM64 family protein [Treponemataceae bacterium]
MGEFFKKHWAKFTLLAVFLIVGLVLFLNQTLRENFLNALAVLTGPGGVEGVVEYIRSYGAYAAAISFFLMILQSIVAPIPAFLITLSNSVIFGWWKGAILSWSSAMAGAAICFYIARILGRDVVEKLNGKGMLTSIESFFERYGKYAIIVARLLPFVPFDIVSYAAGLTPMGFIPFFIATGVGQLPATIVYSYVGGKLTGGAKALMTSLLVLFALSIIIFVWKKIYDDRQAKKKTNGNN